MFIATQGTTAPHLYVQEDIKAESEGQKKEDKHDCGPQQSLHDHLQHNNENPTIFKSSKI